MPFVKIDCAMLNSSLWWEKAQRDIFFTALLMADPFEVREPMEQLRVATLELTGWKVPVGWYGFVAAAGSGIINRAMVNKEEGIMALEQLGEPEGESKSAEFDGRRLVRVNGGYIVLNYVKYRDKDYTSAERSRRWRLRQKGKLPGLGTPLAGETTHVKTTMEKGLDAADQAAGI